VIYSGMAASGYEPTFGNWLRQQRKELGVAQEELAERIGCSTIMLRKLESGERHPSSQIALLLAAYLNIPAEEREAFMAFARTGKAATPESSATRSPWRAHSPGASPSIQTNLPATLTSLIGRELDQERALSYLLNPNVRLLTLTGAPGIGKTRLGLQVTSQVISRAEEPFPDGVFLVELATLLDPDLVLPGIAQALGLRETGGEPVANLLADYLWDRKTLLFLDNFEQVLDAAPAVVKLLERSPNLKVLVTSREALHVRGEYRLPVPPLQLPDLSLFANPSLPGSNPRPALAGAIEELASCASVELFVERARAILPDFELSPQNAQDVAEVCTRLEGLPLAIELAAARVNYLSLSDMRAGLNTRLKVLVGGARDLPARQRTLKSAIEWSYDLLNEAEQKVFRRLSVFVGGCTLEGAEAVCTAPGDLPGSVDLQEVLTALVDKHLVRAVNDEGRKTKDESNTPSSLVVRPSPAIIPHSEGSRYGMLEMIREYAAEKLLASDKVKLADRGIEVEAAEAAHALYFVEFAEKAASRMHGADGTIWINRWEREHDNIREALGYLLGRGPRDAASIMLALRLSAAMGFFWRARGYFSEGREWLSWVLADAESVQWDPIDREGTSLRAAALTSAGWLTWAQGDLTPAGHFFSSGLALYHEVGDKQGTALALNGLAQLALDRLNYEEALNAYQEALEIGRQMGDNSLVARTLNNLGNVYRNMTDYAGALRCYEESLGLYRAMQDSVTMVTPLTNLGLVSSDLEDYPAARRYYEEALRLSRESGNREDIAFALAFVGMLAVEEGDLDAARRTFAEALPLVRDLGYKLVLALCFEGTALMQQKLGRPLEAARLWGRAAAIRDELETPLPVPSRTRYERSVSAARSQADPAAFDAAWSEGTAMPVEEAVGLALEEERA
jgi:predicted ATPase/DNA-binding XRE family transcriptional regulator